MTVARPSRTLEVGAEVGGRYRLISVVDNDVWGATYLAEDLSDASLRLVLKQILVPPLRRELDERLDMFGEALARLHQVRHKSLAPVVDFLKDDHGLYVVMEQVPGTDLASALQSGTGLPAGDTQDTIRITLQVAQGLQALLKAGQHQAVTALTLRHVMLVGRGRAALVNFGVGHFLRPFGLAWKRPEPSDDGRELAAFETDFQRQAVRRVGQMLYALLERRPWSDSAVLSADSLPKDLGPVMLRCLRSGEEGGYDDLDAVIRDLSLLYNVQGLDAWEWRVSETPLPPPPWESMGVSRFALRSTAIGLRSLHSRVNRQRAFLKILAALLVATLITWRILHPSPDNPDVPYVKTGAVVYVACEDGRLQTWSADAGVRLASRTLEAAPSALGWSARSHRLLVCVPSRKRIVTYDVRNNGLGPKVTMQMGCAELAVSPDGRRAFCTGTPATLLGGLDLETMRGTRVVSLPGPCVSMAFSRDSHTLFAATHNPPELLACDAQSGAVTARVSLTTAPRCLRVSPDGAEIWLLAEGKVTVHDAALTVLRTIDLKGDTPVDVGWADSAAYLLWRSASDGRGNLGRVEGTEVDVRASMPTGPEPDGLAVLPDHTGWVSVPSSRTIQVFDLAQLKLTKNLALDAPATGLQWIP